MALMTGSCCWLLLMWQLDSERENPKASVSGDPSRSCKAVYDPAMEVPKCHFCHTLVVKQIAKSSPNSKRGQIQFYLLISSVKVRLCKNLRDGRLCGYLWKIKPATISKEEKLSSSCPIALRNMGPIAYQETLFLRFISM